MPTFQLNIYEGKTVNNSAKWSKHDKLENWHNYRIFYYNGEQDVVSLDIEPCWQEIIQNKLSQLEQQVISAQQIGQYPKLRIINKAFTVVISLS